MEACETNLINVNSRKNVPMLQKRIRKGRENVSSEDSNSRTKSLASLEDILTNLEKLKPSLERNHSDRRQSSSVVGDQDRSTTAARRAPFGA